MNPNREFLDALHDILTEANLARSFVAGIDYDAFAANPEKQRAVIRSLEVIGEAARALPMVLRSRYSQVQWREIVGMRERTDPIHSAHSPNR